MKLRSLTSAGLASAAVAAVVWPQSAFPDRHDKASRQPAHEHKAQHGHDLDWRPAPPMFPAGARMAVLQGDPRVEAALFTVRLRFPSRYVLPPHFHPTDEHVTVIRGKFLVGLGDEFDKHDLLPPLRRGGFITAPANMNHFATTRGVTVVQVHAIGPFQMTYVDPGDDPTQQPRRR